MIPLVSARAAYMFCLFWSPSLLVLSPVLGLVLAACLGLGFRPLFCVKDSIYANRIR